MQTCLFFSQEALSDIRYYVKNSPGQNEISGMGRICKDGSGSSYVKEVAIIKQRVTPGFAEVTPEDMEAFFASKPPEQWDEWRFQWHSHVQMTTGPSGTDTNDYAALQDIWPSFVAMIFNRRDEFWGAHYLSEPVAGSYEFDRIWPIEFKKHYKTFEAKNQPRTMSFLHNFIDLCNEVAENFSYTLEPSAERAAFLAAEIKEKVKASTPAVKQYPTDYSGSFNNWNGQQKKLNFPDIYDYGGYGGNYAEEYTHYSKKNEMGQHLGGGTGLLIKDHPPTCYLVDQFLKITVVNGATYLNFGSEAEKTSFKKHWHSFHSEVKDSLLKSPLLVGYREAFERYGILFAIEADAAKGGMVWNEVEGQYSAPTGENPMDFDEMVERVTQVNWDEEDALNMQMLLEEHGLITYNDNGSITLTPQNQVSNFDLTDSDDLATHLLMFDYWLMSNLVQAV